MKLRGIKFNIVTCASGARGFSGEGYWFHPILRPFGLRWGDSTLTAKTTTLLYNKGFMDLKKNYMPRALFPDCIKVYRKQELALNAVGLSCPGAEPLFETKRWQEWKNAFFLSFMSIKKTVPEKIIELREFVRLFQKYLPSFRAPVGLQLNYSCPNTGHQATLDDLLEEVRLGLPIAATLGIPLMPKINVLVPPEVACIIAANRHCDALCVSNTIPYGQLPDRIPWVELFGSVLPEESPLAKYGGGGLSGKLLLPILLDWLGKARALGLEKPINAGGGILSFEDAFKVFDALGRTGNDSISLGSIAFLHPTRVGEIVDAFQ